MSGEREALALALVSAGALVVILTSLRALLAQRVYNRLHYLTPVTSLAGPLIGLGLAVQSGLNLTTAQILVIVVLLAISGPVLAAAIGRVAAQRDGLIPSESPE